MADRVPDSDDKIRRLFAARLRAARTMGGYPHANNFAKELGIEDETYRRWERAETEPNIPSLVRISALLKVSLDFLLSGKPQAVPQAKVGTR